MHIPAIVAPGGSFQKAVTAARYGADEVYMGVPFTSLRMRSNKVRDFEKLKESVDAVHALWSKVLLTMNIFPRNVDIKIFEAVVERIADLNADGIIFSDPGTFHILRKYAKDTPLHLSTQTTTLNYSAVQFWRDIGVKRIVLARELHIDEVKEIKEKVPEMELEIFVQGAMCMTYSGRCLLWDYMWGRPGNKGECNHACRFQYKVRLEEPRRPWKLFELQQNEEGGSFILSSKDLCVIHRLNELIPYVDAMKIEWRSKSEFYVWGMVKAYKHVRDALIHWHPINPDIQNLVNVIPHREYREGFLFHKLQDFPDGESIPSETGEKTWPSEQELPSTLKQDGTTTEKTPGPLFARNYVGIIEENQLQDWPENPKMLSPKETIHPGMQVNYMTPNDLGVLTITEILDQQGRSMDKADCNSDSVFLKASIPLETGMILYFPPSIPLDKN